MMVSLTNDVSLFLIFCTVSSKQLNQGPVTFTLDSRNFEYTNAASVAPLINGST